jgi:peptidoglycan/LPS O-acetylase OafA/YrhL
MIRRAAFLLVGIMVASPIRSRLPSLDGLRALAIISVILSHSVAIWSVNPRWLEFGKTLRQGVDLFFAISGLLITHLLVKELEETQSINLRAFYIRRAFRILPPVLLYLFVLAILTQLAILDVRRWEFVSSVLFFRNYLDPNQGRATGHFWSLSVEEHFYLLWPACVAMLARKRSAKLAIAVAIVIGVWRGIDARQHLFARLFSDAGVLFRTDARLDALLYGSLAGLVLPKVREFRRVRFGGFVPWGLLIVIVLVNALHLPMLPTVLAISYAALVLSCIIWTDAIWVRWLENRVLRAIGVMSYSLYIWQTLWLVCLPGRWIVQLIALFICAAFSFFVVEQPLRRIGYRLANQNADASRLRRDSSMSVPIAAVNALAGSGTIENDASKPRG